MKKIGIILSMDKREIFGHDNNTTLPTPLTLKPRKKIRNIITGYL